MKDTHEKAVYREVRLLLEQMRPEMRTQAEALLTKAESGEKTDTDLLWLIRDDKELANLLADRLKGAATNTKGYAPLGGEHDVLAPKYVCPQCDYTRYLQKAGQAPGECPEHRVPLIPYEQKAKE